MGGEQSKAYWQKDEEASHCNLCGEGFSLTRRRHHCRNCGFVFCSNCSSHTSPIAMRGITASVRVCDPCFGALIASTRGMSAPPALARAGAWGSGGGGDPIPPEYDSRLQSRERNSAPATTTFTHGLGGAPSVPTSGRGEAPSSMKNSFAGDGQASNPSAKVAPLEPSRQGQVDMPEAEAEPIDEAYNDAYGGASSNPQPPQQQQQQQQQKAQQPPGAASNVSPEQMEREVLARQWATVRQEAQFVDVLVQRAERVEPTSMVEYSRETEAVTLQPEVPVETLGATVLPLPLPADGSARYLMEPVRPWTKNNNKQLFALDTVAAAIGPRLQPPVSQETVRRACPTQFSEA